MHLKSPRRRSEKKLYCENALEKTITTRVLVAGGVLSYYVVLCVSGCRKGDPNTKVVGTEIPLRRFLGYNS